MGEDIVLSDEDQMLMAFDPSKIAHRTPREIKKAAREEWHYRLWLEGKEYAEIQLITGFKRKCVWNDIKRVDARMAAIPSDMESIRKMALMSLRVTRSKIIHSIELAHESKGGRGQTPWGHIAKLYDVLAGIDVKILERYTQAGTTQTASDMADIEKAEIVMDYMTTKFGPEALDGFEEYYTRNLALKTKIVKAKQNAN